MGLRPIILLVIEACGLYNTLRALRALLVMVGCAHHNVIIMVLRTIIM